VSPEFLTVIGMFCASNALYAFWARTASKERRSIINACIARTPAEFAALEAEPEDSRKRRMKASSIPPIGL
jgi:hypothetical protein